MLKRKILADAENILMFEGEDDEFSNISSSSDDDSDDASELDSDTEMDETSGAGAAPKKTSSVVKTKAEKTLVLSSRGIISR